ncbi:MAG: glycosyltransferase family 4 protein [Desulfobacterales bacterium]|nr:glycosyltransferase family 4 protein [Desulfobacterales bacterium]
MTKIVHIITRLDKGGSAINTLFTCQGLSTEYEVVLVHGLSLESRMTDREKQSVNGGIEKAEGGGARLMTLPSLVRKISPVQDLRAFFSLRRLLIREKPAIVHTHTSKAGILGRWAAKTAGIPVIIHTPHGHVFYGHFSNLISKIFLVLEKITSPITDIIVALTETERKDYIKLKICAPDSILTIHSGVEIDKYMAARVNIDEMKRSLGLDPQELIIGTVGWLLPVKGPMYLLKAMGLIWRSHPDTRLVFVGKGDLEEELRGEVFRMGASDKVKFLGWRDDIPEIMQLIDIFVLPSMNEGMGRVLVEAMAAGKPIVASSVGGILDLVEHGRNGLLVEPGDVNGLSSAIKELLTDKEMRKEMGKTGRAMASDFSMEKMLEKIDALYSSFSF